MAFPKENTYFVLARPSNGLLYSDIWLYGLFNRV